MFGVQPLARNLGAALRDLRDPKPKVRVSAANDLARHVDDDRERVIQGLLGALDDDAVEVKTVVAELLGDAKATEAVEPLLKLVDDGAAPVRESAIRALGAIGDAKAKVRLEKGTRDKRPDVRFQSVMAFARVAPRDEAIKALVQATHDEDDFVVHIALRMAEEIADREDEGIDERIVERAARLVDHESARVKAVSAILLASADDPRGDEGLLRVVRGEIATPDHEDVAAGLELAGKRGLREAIPALERRAFGGMLGFGKDPLAWHARTALAALDHPRATKEILAELRSRQRHLRLLGIGAAGRARLRAAIPILREMKNDSRKNDPAIDAALLEIEGAEIEGEGESDR